FNLLTGVNPPYNLSSVNGQQAWGEDQSALGWQAINADLSAFVGQQIKLQFAFRSDGSDEFPGVYIDSIAVAEAFAIPLSITTPSLPSAFVNTAYTASVAKNGGTANSVWSIVSGTNNGWLSIDPSTGALSGTPTAANAGPVSVTVHVEEPALPSNFD